MWQRALELFAHAVARRFDRLEFRMSQTDDVIARIAAAVNKVATDVQTLQTEITDSGDAATAAKLQPIADQLDALDALTPDPAPTEPPADAPTA